MKRRSFLGGSAAAAGVAAVVQGQEAPKPEPFNLHYAPHPGSFNGLAGNDVLDQIRFCADEGFTAFEYNGLARETPEMQEKIGQLLTERGMKMGVFVAYGSFDAPTFARPSEASREMVLGKMREAVEIAKRVNAKFTTVVPGSVDQQVVNGEREWTRYGGSRLAPGYQTANVVEMLKRCAEILEPHELVMVLEPLNWYRDHGGVFLRYADQAYAICKAVGSPSCKILFDIYHQQITEGNLIPNIDQAWDEIAYFQAGDNPGRKEPGTGEINYRNVFKHIHSKSTEHIIGMEHGQSIPGKEGERAVIEAYRQVDDF